MKTLSTFFITVALIVGLASCTTEPTPTQYNLTISSTEGGEVTTPVEGTHTYEAGIVVNLMAEAEEGYRFVEWIGDVDDIADVEDATTTITMNDDYSITAEFAVKQYYLTVSSTEGGSVITPGEGTYVYNTDTIVSLVAEAEEGYEFARWTDNTDTIGDINAASTVITVNDNYSITADFVAEGALYIADPDLEAIIREAIGKPTGPIYPSDLDGLTSLNATAKDIIDLTGLEHCINLTELDLGWNQISDIGPLVQNEGLGEANAVYLWGNPLSWDSINLYIPELRGRGVTVVYDEQEITGAVTVVPNCEGMMAEYTITFNITADLHSGVHSITILFPEGTTVPQAGWQTGNITVNSHDVFGVEVTVVGTKVTFLVPQYIASGTVTVVFKEGAGIMNPPPGWYYMYVNTSRAPDATPVASGPFTIKPAISIYDFVVDFSPTYPGLPEGIVPPMKACGQNDTGQSFDTHYVAPHWYYIFDLVFHATTVGCLAPCENVTISVMLMAAPASATVSLVFNYTTSNINMALNANDPMGVVCNVSIGVDTEVIFASLIHVDSVGGYQICFYADCIDKGLPCNPADQLTINLTI